MFATGSFPNGPPLQTKKALLLIDFQHDFIDPSGNLYVDNISNFIPKLSDLVVCFRQHGEIVWTCTEYRGPRPTFSPETGGFAILLKQFVKILERENSNRGQTPPIEDGAQCQSDEAEFTPTPDAEAFLAEPLSEDAVRCCVPGSTGVNIAEPLASLIQRNKDIVVYKSDYSAFADMSLIFQLRTRMVTNLYICGSLSNISVYATVLDAVRHGFSVTIIEDCVGFRDESCHVSAMRQMADNMCAEGIDYQELMDDLAGLLGDVVDEDKFTTKMQVNLGRHTKNDAQHFGPQIIQTLQPQQKGGEEVGNTTNSSKTPCPLARPNESPDSRINRQRSSTLESSPPRKRSTNDIEDDLEDYQLAKIPPISSFRRSSYESHTRPGSREKKAKIRVRRKDAPDTLRRSEPSVSDQPQPAQSIPKASSSTAFDRSPVINSIASSKSFSSTEKVQMGKKQAQTFLGPGDSIGDGTSSVIYDILSEDYAKRAFEALKANVQWQKMYHRSGEVPRLVAVQGDVTISPEDHSKSYPIYRHPSDESPELLPFDHTVDTLRRECEKHVGHPLNHVLIQHYRDSEDNISEHSDKTLDIVRNSSIVNLSLGAQRTMTLRTKKADLTESQPSAENGIYAATTVNNTSNDTTKPSQTIPGSTRTVQRVPLPHSSLFILSMSTNAKFLHSIRADKRPVVEKSEAELAFNSERISLTFRNIGTFITERPGSPPNSDIARTIWGQGATGKTQATANIVLQPTNVEVGGSTAPGTNNIEQPNDNDAQNLNLTTNGSSDRHQSSSTQSKSEADMQAEKMIIGFGRENHESDSFGWNDIYGQGFDVVNFITRPVVQ